MAAVTSVNILSSSSNVGSQASGAFTPAADDLLLVAVYASGSAAATPTLSSSVGGKTFSLVGSAAGKATSADTLYLFVADQLASATSQTVTFDTTDNVTGTVMNLYQVSGVTVTGTTAIRQFGKQENQASGATPAVTLSGACQTGNPVIAAHYNASTAPTIPSGWTAGATATHSAPTQRGSAYYRDSGETGSTITWGGTSLSDHCSIVAEIETATVVNLTGQGATSAAGIARALPRLSSFTDAFGTLDTTTNWTNSSSASGTASVVSDQLDLTTNGAAGQHATIESQSSFDFRGDEIYVQLVRPCLGTSAVDGLRTIMRVYDTAGGKHGDYVEWYTDSAGTGNLGYRTCDNGGILDNASVGSWSSTNHKWLKISLNEHGTSATWWTAPDSGSGTPGTWTSQRVYSSLPSTFNSVKVALWLENWGASPGAVTQTGRFDGLNGPLTSGTNVALTGQGATSGYGTPVANNEKALTGQAATSGSTNPVAAYDAALVGQGATSGYGAVGTDESVALTGQAGTSGYGTAVANNEVALTGQAATSGYGEVLAGASDNLTGVAANSGFTNPTADNAVALTGQGATTGFTNPVATYDAALVGQAATSGYGSVGTDESVALTGQAGTSGLTSPTAASDVPLVGRSATTGYGTVTPSSAVADAPEAVYTGSVAGFWLDATPISRFDTTTSSGVACTAYGDLFGRWHDRSGNNYDLYITDNAQRGFADTQTSPENWRLYGYLPHNQPGTIDTAGGSSTAFYFAAAVTVRSYYGTIYSDVSSSNANTGFNIRHNADDNAVTFSAGTGSSRVTITKTRPFPAAFGTPSDTQPWVIEAWWDGTNLNLGIDGVYATPVACGTVSAGQTTVLLGETTNATLKAPGAVDDDPCGLHLYEVVQAKNSVPSVATRDAVRAYLTDRITSGGARGLVGQGTTSAAGAVVVDSNNVALTGQAATSGYSNPVANNAVALTGQAATSGYSNPVAVHDAALVGQGATGGYGSVGTSESVALTGVAATASKGLVSSRPKLETLTDAFATIDAAKWTTSSTNGTASIVSNVLDLTTTGAAGSHITLTSVGTFDLNESSAAIRIIRPYLGTNNVDGGRLILRVFDAATGKHGDYVEWAVESNLDLGYRTCDNGSIINSGVIGDWAAASHAWVKITKAGNTATWWTAPDSGSGTPGTWTSRATYSSLPSDFTDVKVALWIENWGTGQGAITQSGQLDNFNLTAEASATLTGQGAASGYGSVVANNAKLLVGQAATSGYGALSGSDFTTLTGHAASTGYGELTPVSSRTLTGQVSTAGYGALTRGTEDVTVTLALAGQRTLAYAGAVNGSYLLLTQFGAVGDGVTNNHTAIMNALAASQSTGKTVLVPEGVFAFSGGVLSMTGSKIQGLGTGSVLYSLQPQYSSIFVYGSGSQIKNLKLDGVRTGTRTPPWEYTKITLFGASNFLIDRVYIAGSDAAGIQFAKQSGVPVSNGVISNCSIYNTKADSIHMTDGVNNVEVHHNEIYNAGDDGIAIVSYLGNTTPCRNITVHHNKVINNLGGRNMSVVGGEDTYHYQNYAEVNNPGFAGILCVCEDNVDWQSHPVKRARFEYNTIKNCGSSTVHAAIMPINESSARVNDDIDFVRNHVIDTRGSPAQGIRLFGPQTNVLLDRNKIDNGGGADYSGAVGDPDVTLILYDSGAYGQTEPVGPTVEVVVNPVGQLTGTALGTLSTSADTALTSQAATTGYGSVSFVTESFVELVGQVATSVSGAASPELPGTITLSGVGSATDVGTLTPSHAQAGVQAATSAGTMTPLTEGFAALVGQAATTSAADPLSGAQVVELVWQALATTSIGALEPTADREAALVGQAATSGYGTVTGFLGTTETLVAQAAVVGQLGDMGLDMSFALPGQAGTASVGTLTPLSERTLVGRLATTAAGTAQPLLFQAITGYQLEPRAGVFADDAVTPVELQADEVGWGASSFAVMDWGSVTGSSFTVAVILGRQATADVGALTPVGGIAGGELPLLDVGVAWGVYPFGTSAWGAEGTVAPVGVRLDGVAAAATTGVGSPLTSKTLTGSGVGVTGGFVTPVGSEAVPLPPLDGAVGTTQPGTLTSVISLGLEGVSISIQNGVVRGFNFGSVGSDRVIIVPVDITDVEISIDAAAIVPVEISRVAVPVVTFTGVI